MAVMPQAWRGVDVGPSLHRSQDGGAEELREQRASYALDVQPWERSYV